MAKKKNTKRAAEARPRHEFKQGNKWRFRPGVSGNLEGRAAENRDSSKSFLAELDNPKIPKTRLRRLMEKSYARACQGSAKHLQICLEHAFGRPTVYTENVNISGDLASMISEARKRAAEAKTFSGATAKQLPESTEKSQDEPQAAPEACKPAQRVIATEIDDGEPKSIMEVLNKPTREPRCLNDHPTFGSWRRPN